MYKGIGGRGTGRRGRVRRMGEGDWGKGDGEEGKGEENGGRKLEEETRNVEGERGKCRSLCFCFVFWAYGTDPQKSSVKEIP